ncbi:hypothetical protein [Brevundimonas sp.]|jgi:hypothetical protein|uniref:hypothetical protein n=1 Tax=Brevundimonas sp. TaxID=1871086 RepID=UPI001A1BE3E5|nr:hypothetical protein [Brevundimonas sp.]MBJ7511354.1 hypothetical protein [Brevundimonas sp.]
MTHSAGCRQRIKLRRVIVAAVASKLQHFDEQGFIGAPEYGQARVIPTPSRSGKTAASLTIPNGRLTS